MNVVSLDGERVVFPSWERLVSLGGVFTDLAETNELLLPRRRMGAAMLAIFYRLALDEAEWVQLTDNLKKREKVLLQPLPPFAEEFLRTLVVATSSQFGYLYNIGFIEGKRLSYYQDMIMGLDYLDVDGGRLQLFMEHCLAAYLKTTPVQLLINECMMLCTIPGGAYQSHTEMIKGLGKMCGDYRLVTDGHPSSEV